jgi:hypothetical protein
VQAYLDFRRFGALPRPGGTFDQPGELLADMRIVADIVDAEEARRQEEEANRGR